MAIEECYRAHDNTPDTGVARIDFGEYKDMELLYAAIMLFSAFLVLALDLYNRKKLQQSIGQSDSEKYDVILPMYFGYFSGEPSLHIHFTFTSHLCPVD